MLFEQLEKSAEEIQFKNVIAFIDEHYDFTPTKFTNGNTANEANQNNGSCKVFSFAKLNDLSKQEALYLFGEFYRDDVLKNPEGTDHQNIRNFMEFGWDGISFEGEALKRKVNRKPSRVRDAEGPTERRSSGSGRSPEPEPKRSGACSSPAQSRRDKPWNEGHAPIK